MSRTNFEVGILRLYYVFWACVVIGDAIGGVNWVISDSNHRFKDVVAWFCGVVIFPPVLMFAVRWVYRGFLPQTKTV